MTRTPIRPIRVALLSAALLALPSCSDKAPPPQAKQRETKVEQEGVPGSITVETTTISANVVSVFPSTREVVLDVPGGKREVVTCGPQVINFDQIKPGDQVNVMATKE